MRLLQLKDAELAQRLHREQLDLVSQQAHDGAMAKALAARLEAGCKADALCDSLQGLQLDEQPMTATLSYTAALGEGAAGCGAVLHSAGGSGSTGRWPARMCPQHSCCTHIHCSCPLAAGRVLWEGGTRVTTARYEAAHLEAALVGLSAAAQLGLPAEMALVLEGSSAEAAEMVRCFKRAGQGERGWCCFLASARSYLHAH